MKGIIEFAGSTYCINWSKPISIAIPLIDNNNQVNCFGAPPVSFNPVVAGDFVGSTKSGSPVNFYNIQLNPHGNGTHTECVGHISKEDYYIKDTLVKYHFVSLLISLTPVNENNGDEIITRHLLEESLNIMPVLPECLIIRTLPNDQSKMSKNYNGSNPPYLTSNAINWLKSQGINHLLIDLPSVDKEHDGGALAAHKAFWNYPDSPRLNDTITELVFIHNNIKDGLYLLNLQILNIALDASPSHPILYALEKSEIEFNPLTDSIKND